MDTSKKYKKQGKDPYPHIGALIEKVANQKKLSNTQLSRRLGISSTGFSAYLSQESVQMGILWKVSLAMEHNFFADLMEHLPEATLNSADSVFQKTIKAQQDTIKDLEKEIAIYKEILARKI